MKAKPIEATTKFVDALNRKFQGARTPKGPIEFTAEYAGRFRGQQLDRILLPTLGTPDGSGTHAFVDRATGNLLRAASRDLPATDSRYDLSDAEDFAMAVALADPIGNYLRRDYIRKNMEAFV